MKILMTVAIKCDRCGKQCDLRDDLEYIEGGEFLSYEGVGGYGSPHGDGVSWSIDLCAPCTVEVLGPWIRNGEEDE